MTASLSTPASGFSTPLADNIVSRVQSNELGPTSIIRIEQRAPYYLQGRVARKRLGILLMLVVVVLWVSSSFLTYAIFSDDSYSKPYFVTYLNTSVFCLYLVPWATQEGLGWWNGEGRNYGGNSPIDRNEYHPLAQGRGQADAAGFISEEEKLGLTQTMKLSAEFCLMWFIANYFQSYCLKWTSVSSATILSCTSSIFTLILSAILKIERFSWTKLLSVFLSLTGISIISSLDFGNASESTNSNIRTPAEILLGDGMALLGALSYGIYTTLLKARVGHESRVSMQMFFGFVGLFNLLCLWPGLVALHVVGVEKFELPPDRRIWWIVAINASVTLVSDFCWAYAMLLTTPLIVTVGLSLSIPLAILGQILFQRKFPKVLYWVGAALVLIAFLFINKESETLDSAMETESSDTEEVQTEGSARIT